MLLQSPLFPTMPYSSFFLPSPVKSPSKKLNPSVWEEGWMRSCAGGSGGRGDGGRGIACFTPGAESLEGAQLSRKLNTPKSADVPDSRLFGGSGHWKYPCKGMWSVHMTPFCCDSSAPAKSILVTTWAISGLRLWRREQYSPGFV